MKLNRIGYPYLIWLGIFILIPLLLVTYFAFTTGDSQNFSTFTFSMENFEKFMSPIYLGVLYRSVRLAIISTVICLVLGYPIALIISKEKPKIRNILVLMRSEEHTSELQSRPHLVCRLLLEKKKKQH